MSKPTSPLPTSGERRGPSAADVPAERFSPLGSSLSTYHPGSMIAANMDDNTIKVSHPALKSYAATCRKIRNDISDEEKQEILMAFELFDSRKSGKLNSTELKVAMRALDFQVKKEDVRKIIYDHTKGRSEEIDQEDFIEILTKKYKEKDPEEDLLKAFKYFDEDNTGKISLKNLRKIAKDLGEHITDEELAAMIDEFDKDGDGEINESEFFGIMKRDDLDL
ncbi:unnamed protein product [Calypogeia fissa]